MNYLDNLAIVNLYILPLRFIDENFLFLRLPYRIRCKYLTLSSFKRKEIISSEWIRYFVFSRLLDISRANLFFSVTMKGRPYLQNYDIVDFNISNNFHYIIMSVIACNRIGIDIQKINNSVNCLKISKRYFSNRKF